MKFGARTSPSIEAVKRLRTAKYQAKRLSPSIKPPE
jgi:hypothetical protein